MVESPVHWKKAEVARMLHEKHGLPNIEELLVDLNQARKGAADGDVELPDLDPEDVARRIEEYVEAVRHFVRIGEGENG